MKGLSYTDYFMMGFSVFKTAKNVFSFFRQQEKRTDYQELRIDITHCTEEATDLLAAYLADAGYESFVPDEAGLTAYIAACDFDLKAVEEIIASFPMEIEATLSDTLVEGRDWNSEWEKNYFKPIRGGRRVRGALLIPHRRARGEIRHSDRPQDGFRHRPPRPRPRS